MDIIVETLPESKIELNYEFTKALIGSLTHDLDQSITAIPEKQLTAILQYLLNQVDETILGEAIDHTEVINSDESKPNTPHISLPSDSEEKKTLAKLA